MAPTLHVRQRRSRDVLASGLDLVGYVSGAPTNDWNGVGQCRLFRPLPCAITLGLAGLVCGACARGGCATWALQPFEVDLGQHARAVPSPLPSSAGSSAGAAGRTFRQVCSAGLVRRWPSFQASVVMDSVTLSRRVARRTPWRLVPALRSASESVHSRRTRTRTRTSSRHGTRWAEGFGWCCPLVGGWGLGSSANFRSFTATWGPEARS